jgi:L-alanine-DL-glutamate epimerase-like enolase superfamily enzyme
VKIDDTRRAVEIGADEIDMVIDRGAMLVGDYAKVFDEIASTKEAGGAARPNVILETDGELQGHGLTFTIGRGNEVVVTAVRALAPLIVGRTLASITANLGAFWRHITGDSQLRWIGPEKGAIHLATAAVVNAVWDLYAKREGKPLDSRSLTILSNF